MTATHDEEATPAGETWEQEIVANHRWGQHGDRAAAEHGRLKALWDALPVANRPDRQLLDQVLLPEICNWNLEGAILALCEAIGSGRPHGSELGHMASISKDRWRKVWAYYLTLRDWLPREGTAGHEALLTMIDPDNEVRNHVRGLLGERDELKERYVERFCLCLEMWLYGRPSRDSAWQKAHDAAVAAVEEEIRKRDPEGRILNAMKLDGNGRLQPCGHKAFRRYDIILSSIGAGGWRAAMPMHGTDGFERAAVLEQFLAPIEAWISGDEPGTGDVAGRVHTALGQPDAAKVFLASLLVSLLRAQQLAAAEQAERRVASRER